MAWAQAYQNVVLRNSFNPLGAGARGMGMGGAFIAVADDGTAASFNPAGLAQVRRSELAFVGFWDTTGSTLQNLENGQQQLELMPESVAQHGTLDFAGLSVPFDVLGRKLTVELSYQRAVDLFGKGRASVVQNVSILPELGLPDGTTQDYGLSIESEQHGAFHTASLAAGFEVTNRLSLGAAVSYWIANWTTEGQLGEKTVISIPGAPAAQSYDLGAVSFKQDQSFRGVGLSAGFLLKYPRVSIGGVVHLPFTAGFTLNETGNRITYAPTSTESPYQYQNVRCRLDWPWTTGLGVALRPFRKLTIAADYTHAQWSRMILEDLPDGTYQTTPNTDSSGLPISSYTDRSFFDLNPASLTDTRDTDGLRAGIEYLITASKVVIPIRLGWFRDESPVPDIEGARVFRGSTIGTGLNFDWLKFDVAGEFRASRGNFEALALADGTLIKKPGSPEENVVEFRLVGSLILRFGGKGDDPLKRLFRYLFVGPKEEG